VKLDGREPSSTASAVAGGTRIAIDVPLATRSSHLQIEAGGRHGHLLLRPSTSPEWAVKANELKTRGDHAGVSAIVQPHIEDADASVRARALGLLARAELALGRIEDAATHFRRSMKDAETAGRISDAVDDGLALSFMFSRAARWAEARVELARVEPMSRGYPDGRARLPYYRALASFAFGDIRASMRELDAARLLAERLGLVRLVWNIRNERALALERWGRRDEAIAELTSLLARPDEAISACDRATASFNLGFATMVRAQETAGPCTGPPPNNDAEAWLARSIEHGARCPDAARSAMGHVLLGDLALGRGDLDRASAELGLVDLREATLGLRRDHLDLKARIHLARNEGARALDDYERLVALARAEGRVDDERRALEGVGRALEASGKYEEAMAAFTASDELLAAASILVPLGEVGFYQAARDTATRARVELLVGSGRTREALDVARTARVRLLTSVASLDRINALPPESRVRWEAAVNRYRVERKKLDAEGANDWERASSDLARVRAERGEALKRLRGALDDALLEMPRTTTAPLPPLESSDATVFAMTARTGAVLVFYIREGALLVTALGPATVRDAPSATRAIFGAVSNELAQLGDESTVRIVTSADLACLDLHAQPLPSGTPLARVVYGLDVPITSTPKTRPARALVVSDSRDDLPFSRDEGKLIAGALAKNGGTAMHLMGRAASGPAFHDALQEATIFHYAGHAFEADGDIVLPLAAGARFTSLDVLALPVSPERVTLSACTAGRIAPSGVALGMGLVQAFVERGTREVVAPTRPVRDEVALALARALVDVGTSDPQRALLRLRKEHPDFDWAAYRVWGR
jgi:cellulose synthase operon protein C